MHLPLKEKEQVISDLERSIIMIVKFWFAVVKPRIVDDEWQNLTRCVFEFN